MKEWKAWFSYVLYSYMKVFENDVDYETKGKENVKVHMINRLKHFHFP
jgi:hypothetical protein